MKNNSKKLFSMIMAGLLLALNTAMTSCGGGELPAETDTADTSGTETAAPETETETEKLTPDIPVQDFEGYEFTAIHWVIPDDWKSRLVNDFCVDEVTGNALNDAVYNRNMAVSETYNIKYRIDYQDVVPNLKRLVQAGDDAYDIAYQLLVESTAIIPEGLLYNLYDIPYLGLDMPWWDQNSVSSLAVGNSLLMASSAISVEDKNATTAILFNKNIAADYGVEDLYTLVSEGGWTMDRMHGICEDVVTDTDGDGRMTLDDLWGFLGKRDAGYCIYFGAGGSFISRDADGNLYDSFKTDYNVNLLQKVQEMMSDETSIYDQHRGSQDAGSVDDTPFRELFMNGHGLFFWSRFDDVLALRDMDVPFGILPIPKYSEDQNQYTSLVSRHTTALLGIPVSVQDTERTGIITEALSAESFYTVTPAYYDTTLKGKATRDEDSAAMVDLIFANRIYDLGDIYDIGSWPSYVLLNLITKADKGVVSEYESYKTKIETGIQDFLKNYAE